MAWKPTHLPYEIKIADELPTLRYAYLNVYVEAYLVEVSDTHWTVIYIHLEVSF